MLTVTDGGRGGKNDQNLADLICVAPQGPQNRTKKLTHLVDILGHLLSRNHVSNFFDLGTPPS